MIAAQPVTAQYSGSATARILSSALATSVWEMQFEFRVPPPRRSVLFDNAAVTLNSTAEPDLVPGYVRAVWADTLPLAASFPTGQVAAGAFNMAPMALSIMSVPHAGSMP